MRVAIIGAGPAGSTLAYNLAVKGIDVEVYEALDKPRGVCGGALGVWAVDYMRRYNPHVDEAIKYSLMHTIREARICISRMGRVVGCVDAKSEDIGMNHVGYIVNRTEFDYYLARKAEEAGAVIHWGTRASAESLKQRYDIVVDAGGFTSWSRARKRPETLILEQYWAPSTGETLDIYYDTVIHRGYIWVFPAGGVSKIGFGEDTDHYPDNRMAIREIMASISGFESFDELYRKSVRRDYAALPLFTPRRTRFYRSGVFYVGTAAGLVDPLTGAGIKYAVASAGLLASSISRGTPTAVIRSRYVSNVYMKIVGELLLLRRARAKILALARSNPEGALEMAKLMKEAAKRRGVASIRYLARLALKVLG